MSKFHSEQARAPLYKLISHSIMGLYGIQYDYIIHVALIATSHGSLLCHKIPSFQPPLILYIAEMWWPLTTGVLGHTELNQGHWLIIVNLWLMSVVLLISYLISLYY